MKLTRTDGYIGGLCVLTLVGLLLWGYKVGNFQRLSHKLTTEEKAAVEQNAIDRMSDSDRQFDPAAEDVTQKVENVADTLSWKMLSQVQINATTADITQGLEFSEGIRKLEGHNVTITGYMFPLHAGEQHTHFLLSAYPPSCPYCLPGGPTDLIEVKDAEPIAFSLSHITLQGIFHIGEKEALQEGMFYSLAHAHKEE